MWSAAIWPATPGPRAGPVAQRLHGPVWLRAVSGGDVCGAGPQGHLFQGGEFPIFGESQGRGRHAPTHECTRSKKKVFVYELDRDWRRKLEVPHVELRPRLEVGVGLDTDQWAEQEYGCAELGESRRTARLVNMGYLLAATIGRPITAGPRWDRPAVEGFYRFIEKADQFGITRRRFWRRIGIGRSSGCGRKTRCSAFRMAPISATARARNVRVWSPLVQSDHLQGQRGASARDRCRQ